jgi:hypothetical protein
MSVRARGQLEGRHRGLAVSVRGAYPTRDDHPERVIWVLTSAVETLLALRLGLRLLAVPDGSPPVHVVYQVTDPVVGLFNLGIFHLGAQTGGVQMTFQLEPDSLVAMMVVWLVGWIITVFVGLATSGREATR